MRPAGRVAELTGVVIKSLYEVKEQDSFNRASSTHVVSSCIEYRYSVGGSNCVSRRIKLVGAFLDDGPGESLVQRHPQGMAVAVHFNPSKPDEAVLLPGPTVSDGVLTILGIGSMIAGIGVFRAGGKKV